MPAPVESPSAAKQSTISRRTAGSSATYSCGKRMRAVIASWRRAPRPRCRARGTSPRRAPRCRAGASVGHLELLAIGPLQIDRDAEAVVVGAGDADAGLLHP